ncbi:lysophospholipid acyltransferase family protein [soil metagenome]
MARWSLRHMGRTLIDFSLFPFFTAKTVPEIFDFQGLENLEAASAKGKGVLMLSLHLGNGDFGVAAISRSGWPVSLISKNFKSKWLNDLWFGMRGKHGTQFIAPEKSSFQILRALKAKRLIFFVLDQFMGPPVGCRTKFFGRETGTAMGLAIMAERSRAPVVPAYTYRQKNGRQMVVFEPEVAWQDASSANESDDQNIATMTQIYTDRIEAMIRQHPEQWMWIHRRWKNF